MILIFLSKVNIVNDAACSCGTPREDAFRYVFTCPNYTEIRRIMMNNLNWVQPSDLNLNLLTVTRGSDDLTYEENINIIKQLMKSSPIYTINSHSIMIILSMHIIHIEIYCK
jgi:hypothetical protein